MDFDADDGPTQMLDPFLMRAQMRVGTTLRSKWRLDVLLGIGGMATVYAATHRNGNRAAVKILHSELSFNHQLRSRFLREGYLANSVGHEGAVKVIDDDIGEDGTLFLVTELLDGETLEERRARFGGSLPEHEVLWLADQILDVLAAAHSKNIVHRDLKPENIFLTRKGQVKVLDFGIARLRELSTTSTATKAGVTLGTPAYMPPEQALGLWDEVESRSDLWACGATMFHLLTGRYVHVGRSHNEQLLNAMTKAAALCATASPNVDPAVAHVIDRALAFERERRWPDAESMQEAVRRAYAHRHGAGIGTAPRLMIPDIVVDRTLPSAQEAPHLDTSRPVESDGRKRPTTPGRAWLALAVGGAIALGAALSLISSGRGSGNSAASARPTFAQPVVVAAPASSADPTGGAAPALAVIALEAAAEPSSGGSVSRDPGINMDSSAAADAMAKRPLPLPTSRGGSLSPMQAYSGLPSGYKTDLPY